MTRLEEIEARMAEIDHAVNSQDADLDALEKEVRSLKDERTKINESAEKRAALLKDIADGKVGKEMNKIEKEITMENRTYGVETAEYRSAFLRNLQGKELEIEERAITASGAIPTQTMNKVISAVELSPILSAIDMTYIPSNVTYPVESAFADAAWVAMGTAATDGTDTLGTVTLSAYKLIKTLEVTADVQNMSIDAFENWLTGKLGEKIRKALDASVFKGTGTNQPQGIETAISTATGTYTKAGMTYKDLCKIMSSLGSAYAQNGTFAMPRKLFFEDVMGMTDTSGKPVVVQDPQSPAKYNILGYPVILDDNMTADNVIFGDFKYFKLNVAKSPTIEQDNSVAFRTGSTVYRAMALADGKCATTAAFVKYGRATA